MKSAAKGLLLIAALVCACLVVAGTSAANDRHQGSNPTPPPVYELGTSVTDHDNAGTGCAGAADLDMGATGPGCLFNTNSIAPVDFNIDVETVKSGSYVLNILAWDVESGDGEVDEVRLNGVLLGNLTGAANTWSLSTLAVPGGTVVAGNNCVEVSIDTGNPGLGVFCTEVRYGSLVATQPFPGLSPYGLLAAAMLLVAAGVWTVRRRRAYEV